MKSPNHPVPSGDREMARNLIALLEGEGAEVTLTSELRSHEKQGALSRQSQLRAEAEADVARLLAELPEISLWVTYHNYYKAPDLIGPRVAAARGIPYVQVESTRAKKRLSGPWAGFAEAAHQAADAADVIFYLTEQDHFALNRDRAPNQKLVHLPPFLPQDTLPPASTLDGPMLAVGMMRGGDKLASYRLIAAALACLDSRGRAGDWRLCVAGDGPARAEVEALFAPFGAHVDLLGQLDRDALAAAYGQASLFLWPGVNEAFGMVYLEAQAHGLPVVAQDRPGLRDVLAPSALPRPDKSQGAFAMTQVMEHLLTTPEARHSDGAAARDHIAARHLAPAARDRLWSALAPLLPPEAP
ncbi:glycosyltransferase family 4 protein [Tritonibacter multivorans]|nr:glycosyltransferase family 4 protein [Tritonibacter multivorans]MDA7419619.1 glycosyltransferase family 4 protein [Tritonibacter multivorans]